jgi:hypothetical protein
MLSAIVLVLFQAAAPSAVPVADAKIDFYSLSNQSEDIEVEVEAEGLPKAGPEGAKPVRATRMFTWHAGGNDNSELARIVAEALGKAGLDTSYEGAELIVKNAVSVQVHAKDWTVFGAQVWMLTPKKEAAARVAVTFEGRSPIGKAACVVTASAKAAAPKPPETDDLAAAKFPEAPASDPKKKDPKAPPVKPKEPAKPADPKARPADPRAKNVKPIDVKAGLPEGTAGSSVLASILTLARAAGWKAEPDGARVLRVDTAPDGAPPKWAAIRFAGKGSAAIGVKCVPEGK